MVYLDQFLHNSLFQRCLVTDMQNGLTEHQVGLSMYFSENALNILNCTRYFEHICILLLFNLADEFRTVIILTIVRYQPID